MGNQSLKAHPAMVAMVAHPKSAMPQIQYYLGLTVDTKDIGPLLKDLHSPNIKIRDGAAIKLIKIGPAAYSFLRKELAKPISPELRDLVNAAIQAIQAPASKELGFFRIIDVLEHINNSEARELLETIAGGGYGEVPAQAAKTSLKIVSKK